MKGRKRKTNKARIPYAGGGRGTEGSRRKAAARGRARKDGARSRGIKKKREEVYPRRGVEGREAGRAGRASVHGRATHARSIKRAFTIDQRSIEVDHELKTVVTREARRPRQLFARLCKYLAAERRTRRWAPLGWGAVHARPPPSNLRSSVHEIRSTRVYVLRTYVRTYVSASRRADIIILGPPPPPISTSVGRTRNAAHRNRANFQRIIAPADRANRRDREVCSIDRSIEWHTMDSGSPSATHRFPTIVRS